MRLLPRLRRRSRPIAGLAIASFVFASAAMALEPCAFGLTAPATHSATVETQKSAATSMRASHAHHTAGQSMPDRPVSPMQCPHCRQFGTGLCGFAGLGGPAATAAKHQPSTTVIGAEHERPVAVSAPSIVPPDPIPRSNSPPSDCASRAPSAPLRTLFCSFLE